MARTLALLMSLVLLAAGAHAQVSVKDDRGVYHLAKDSPAIGKGAGAYPFVTEDIDGQPRPAEQLDVGADQFSTEAGRNRPLKEQDVGPNAPEEKDRPLISAPKVQWIAAAK